MQAKGYLIASGSGEPVSEPSHDVLGILEPINPKGTRHIGTLWIHNDARKAYPDTRWVLEVYGRDNVPRLTEIVKEILESEPTSVKVRIKLERESRKPADKYVVRGK